MEVEQRRASSERDAARFLDEMQPWVEHEQQRQQQVEPPPPPLDETSAPADGVRITDGKAWPKATAPSQAPEWVRSQAYQPTPMRMTHMPTLETKDAKA